MFRTTLLIGLTFIGSSCQWNIVDKHPLITGFSYVQGGSFLMGGNNGKDDEKPPHMVTVKGFYLSTKELTVKEYQNFCTATGRALPTTPDWGWQDTYPIVNITWADATAYCQWLSNQTGKKYRLPTEAEWEYAAKGGTQNQNYKYAGSDTIDEVAWSNSISQGSPHPVGTRPKANQLGLYDMTGNVHEWCNDWYSSTYYQSGETTNPQGPASGTAHLFRGGSWSGGAFDNRLESRFSGPSSGPNIGLRLALDQ